MDKPRRSLIYIGESFFSNPLWKEEETGFIFGSLEVLVPDEKLGLTDERSINEYFSNNMHLLSYWGTDVDDDPDGRAIKHDRFRIISEEEQRLGMRWEK